MLQPGQTIDRYTVEAILGEGGMAMVYQVRHVQLASTHALKVLTTDDPKVRERLLAEGRALGQLQHVNALSVTDVIDVDGAPGLVMELIPTGTLEDWIERERPDREDRLEVFRQVVDCVTAAHELGWVHRDLKPANILMQRIEDRWIPKVADFGLVKALESPLGRAKTRSGVAMGTPGFMAPEQFEDASSVDVTADVFSLGCVLVWLLTEEIPFPGEGVLDVYKNVTSDRRVRLKPDDPLRPVVERCLQTAPADRFPDAGALLDALGGRKTNALASLTEPRDTQPEPPDAPETPASPARTPAEQAREKAPSIARSPIPLLGCVGLTVPAILVITLVLLVLAVPFVRHQVRRNAATCNLRGNGSMGFVRTDEPVAPGWWTLRRGVTVFAVKQGRTFERCRLPPGSKLRVDAVEPGRVNLVYDDGAKLPPWPAAVRLVLGRPQN